MVKKIEDGIEEKSQKIFKCRKKSLIARIVKVLYIQLINKGKKEFDYSDLTNLFQENILGMF